MHKNEHKINQQAQRRMIPYRSMCTYGSIHGVTGALCHVCIISDKNCMFSYMAFTKSMSFQGVDLNLVRRLLQVFHLQRVMSARPRLIRQHSTSNPALPCRPTSVSVSPRRTICCRSFQVDRGGVLKEAAYPAEFGSVQSQSQSLGRERPVGLMIERVWIALMSES